MSTNALSRMAGPTGMSGGALWIAHVAMWIAHGTSTGRVLIEDTAAPLWRIDLMTFLGAYAALGIALLGMAGLLIVNRRWAVVGWVGGVVACVPILVGVGGMIISALLPAETVQRAGPYVGAPGIMGLFLAAILLGIAHARVALLPRRVGVLVLAFGLLTLPTGLGLMFLEGRVPEYVYAEFHFVFAGLAWIAIGMTLASATRRDDMTRLAELRALSAA